MNAIENEQLCSQCVQAFMHGSDRLGSVPGLIKGIIETEAWRERKVQTGRIIKLDSFRDLIVLPPLEGWGEDPTKIEAVIRNEAEVLALWEKAIQGNAGRPSNERQPKSVDNINRLSSTGTSRAYTVTRLKSQHPKLFEQVKAGKMSANAAAMKAGFRKKTITVEPTVDGFAKAIHKQLSAEQCHTLN
jgi:hypothetical protein